ncbi:hypothetical protein [Nannocystis pusilla]|uniref:hypothetical protein n=1 Tax=Nannocystis pusilla TaxID=889268 RepID=UPI003DA40410
MRPDFALMSPRYQKVYMLAWISRARSFDEQFQGEHKITVLVRRIAHELTNLSKTLWPGSVQALQMNAVPACVVTELGLKTLHAPKTWAEAHEFVQNHRERAMTSEVPVDDYGWADRPRKAPPGQPRALLREAQRAVEAIAGNVTDPPPRHLTTPPEELPNEQLDALVKHAQALRDIRRFIAAEEPETWGAVMGRLRWLAGRLGERLPQLRRWLDPEFIPPPERAKTGPSADQVRQQQATVRAERDALVAADSFDDEALLAFLGRAFDAHNTPEVASLVQPIRPRIDALRPDLFEDRRMRRRLTGLQERHQARRARRAAVRQRQRPRGRDRRRRRSGRAPGRPGPAQGRGQAGPVRQQPRGPRPQVEARGVARPRHYVVRRQRPQGPGPV